MQKTYLFCFLFFIFTLTLYQCSSNPSNSNSQNSTTDSQTTDTLTTEEVQTYNKTTKEINDALQSINVNSILKIRSDLIQNGTRGITKTIVNLLNISSSALVTNYNGSEGSSLITLGQVDFADDPNNISYLENRKLLYIDFSEFKQSTTSSKLNGIYNENTKTKTFFNQEHKATNVTYITKSYGDLTIESQKIKWEIDISIIKNDLLSSNQQITTFLFSESGKINGKNYTFSTNITVTN